MHLVLDLDSDVPIYQQIRDRVIEAIADGQLREGAPLPSTRQLAMDLSINFHTVNKAYDLLRQEGIIRVNRKSGAVIRRDRGSGPADARLITDWHARLRTLLAEAVAHGIDAGEVDHQVHAVLHDFDTARDASA